MKEIKVFQCEYCGTEYKYKCDADECESNHKKLIGKNDTITKIVYNSYKKDKSGYPLKFNIKFSDGKTIQYIRG